MIESDQEISGQNLARVGSAGMYRSACTTEHVPSNLQRPTVGHNKPPKWTKPSCQTQPTLILATQALSDRITLSLNVTEYHTCTNSAFETHPNPDRIVRRYDSQSSGWHFRPLLNVACFIVQNVVFI
jgi:hypothetical protein